MTLNELVGHFREWLHLPDPYLVEVTLAAWAANQLPGRSVWLMIVGPPSSGKTDILDVLRVFDDVTQISSISGEAALLSGTEHDKKSKGATGGLLGESGSRQTLTIKDFTTVISMREHKRNELLAAFRELYDGRWSRNLGNEGGKALTWYGKLGILAAVTPKIDKFRGDMADLGERWMYVRVPEQDPIALAVKALDESGRFQHFRNQMYKAAREWRAGLDFGGEFPRLDAEETIRIARLAAMTCAARSHVERDSRSREVSQIPEAEATPRFSKMLHSMYAGLKVIKVEAPLDTLARCAKDAIPQARLRLLECAARGVEFQKLGMSHGMLQRSREDLQLLKLFDGNELTEHASEWWGAFENQGKNYND